MAGHSIAIHSRRARGRPPEINMLAKRFRRHFGGPENEEECVQSGQWTWPVGPSQTWRGERVLWNGRAMWHQDQ